jgi:hypothetical protein
MDPDDAASPVLFVHREAAVFHLDELCGETFRKLGEHQAWVDLVRAVRSRLLGPIPNRQTLH